jgi:hypothetical protein
MARIEEHMKDCKRMLGKPYKRVHEFLDQYAEMFPVRIFTEYHRSFLHNKYGLEIIKGWWGLEAEKAGQIHIIRDYSELPVKDWKAIDRYLNRSLLYFHYLDNFEPHVHPHVVKGWGDNSLVSIAMGE